MKALNRRLGVLEQREPAELSPAVRRWLGWPLTLAERQALADEKTEPVDWLKVDTSGWSKEARKWWLD